MLEAIIVYWQSLAYIPKSILHKIKKTIFVFLWIGRHEKENMALVRWERLVKPKKEGVWGLKKIFLFPKALATKSLLKVILGEGLH
jgi:hypothetical protein